MPCSGGLDNNEIIIVLLVFQPKQKGSNCIGLGLDLHDLRHYNGHRLVSVSVKAIDTAKLHSFGPNKREELNILLLIFYS